MTLASNDQLVLRARPTGTVTADCFELVSCPVDPPRQGQVLVRTLWLSFNATQRGWLNDVPSYMAPVGIGEVMRAWGVGEVVASEEPGYAAGDLVTGWLGWRRYWLTTADDPDCHLSRVPVQVSDPTLMLTVAGFAGLAAYFGMTEIGRPGAGDTVLVTAAAGATGSIAGQIARLKGACKVVGTAGNEYKRAWARDVAGFDECVCHYDEKVRRALGEHAPDGYDLVFDNVGGQVLDAALFNVALGARVVLCGAIATGYRPERPSEGLHYYPHLINKRARMEGFVVLDRAELFPPAQAELLRWVDEGKLHVATDVLDGLEQAPAGLRRLFEGRNLGKQLLHVADPEITTSRRSAHP